MRVQLLLWCFCFIVFSCVKKNTLNASNIAAEKSDSNRFQKVETLQISKDFVLGKFDYKKDSTFVMVDSKYATKTIYLKKATSEAFLELVKAAKKDGISFNIISGTRSFIEQKAIWERKWQKHATLEPLRRAKKILDYSSMPASSRHHWGTDIDLNSLNNSYFNNGKGLVEYKWLVANANRFGFYQVYTDKSTGRTGYKLEKWHWSYLPLASQYLAYYNNTITNDDIKGFLGSELSEKLHIIEDYVNGISKQAKKYK